MNLSIEMIEKIDHLNHRINTVDIYFIIVIFIYCATLIIPSILRIT
jgi:hypothetical protein